jgi:DNA-binding LacI/PurR family transcriptional regulator
MALGFIHGLAERGLSVPGDISVVGFDDVPDAAHFLPPLTTVRQDFAALGALAVRSIIAAINDEDWALREMIEPGLVVRESTGPPSSRP